MLEKLIETKENEKEKGEILSYYYRSLVADWRENCITLQLQHKK